MDEDEEDEEEVVPEPRGASTDIAEGVTPKKANEFTCTGCFLLVNRGQFGPRGAMHCPVGEAECPALTLIESGALDTPVRTAKSARSAAKTSAKTTAKKPAKKQTAEKPTAKAPARKSSTKRSKD